MDGKDKGYHVAWATENYTLVVPIVMTWYGKFAWEGNIVSPDQLIVIGYDMVVVLCYKDWDGCMHQCNINLQKKLNKWPLPWKIVVGFVWT